MFHTSTWSMVMARETDVGMPTNGMKFLEVVSRSDSVQFTVNIISI